MSDSTQSSDPESTLLDEARQGDRCQFCLTKSETLQDIPQVPAEYRETNVGNGRTRTLCTDCNSALTEIFDDSFFFKAGLILNALREDTDLSKLDEFPVEPQNNEDNTSSPDTCTICGVTDPRVIEQHHPFPRRHLPTGFHDAFPLAILCSNCHNRIERLYDDYFFEQIGVNTGIEKQDTDTDSEHPQSLPTVRELIKDFVDEECRYSEGATTRHQPLNRTFYKYLDRRGYEYNATHNCIHRTIDEFAEYATWVHDPETATYEVRGGYWSYGRFDNLVIPNIDPHAPTPEASRQRLEERVQQYQDHDDYSDTQESVDSPLEDRTLDPIATSHADLLSIELYGLEYSADMDVLAVATGVTNNANSSWTFDPDDCNCIIDGFAASVKREGYFDGIPGSWNFLREDVAPGTTSLFLLFVESPPGTTLTQINYEAAPASQLQDGRDHFDWDERETIQLAVDGERIDDAESLPAALNLESMDIE